MDENIIAKWFGGCPLPFSWELNGAVRRGWTSNELNNAVARDVVQRNAAIAESSGIRLFHGLAIRVIKSLDLRWRTGIVVYAIENISEIEIAELCDVGMPDSFHSAEDVRSVLTNSKAVSDAKKAGIDLGQIAERIAKPNPEYARSEIRKLLTAIEAKVRFRIISAAPKSLEAHFLQPFQVDFADWAEAAIAKVNIEAFDATDPLTISEFILQNRAFVLWWD